MPASAPRGTGLTWVGPTQFVTHLEKPARGFVFLEKSFSKPSWPTPKHFSHTSHVAYRKAILTPPPSIKDNYIKRTTCSSHIHCCWSKEECTWITAWKMVDGHEENSSSKEQGGRWVREAAGAPSLGFPASGLDKISSWKHRVCAGLLSPASCAVSCLWAFWRGPVLQGWQLFRGDSSCCGHRLKQYRKPISIQISFYTCSLLSTSHTLWSCNSSLVLPVKLAWKVWVNPFRKFGE